jgi:hypothetical protein
VRRPDRHDLAGTPQSPALVPKPGLKLPESADLRGENRSRNRAGSLPVPFAGHLFGQVEHYKYRWKTHLPCQREVTLSTFIIEAQRVDNSQQTTLESSRDHLIKNGKRVGAGIEIVFT